MRHIHQKIFWAYLLPLIAGIVAIDFFLGNCLDRFLLAQKDEELRRLCALFAGEVSVAAVEARDLAAADRWCGNLGNRLQLRVTLISPDGVVLGDSDIELADLHSVENHANRPEIRLAKEKGFGTDRRRSRTLGVSFLYGAMLIRKDEASVCYLRLAVPLVEMAGVKRRVHGFLFLGTLLAIVIAALGGYLTSRLVSRPLKQITEAAQRLGAGDFSVQIPGRGGDEVGTLGRVLNQMREDLQQKLQEIKADRNEVGAILEGMSEGVIAVDLSDRILFCNSAAGRFLGFDCSDVEGRLLLDATRMPGLYAFARDVLGTGKEARTEFSGFTPEEQFWEVVGVPLLGAGGSMRGALLVLHDVTETKHLERTRRDFVANVSHEMKTPLTTIRGFAETLLEGGLEDKENNRRFVEHIKTNAERLEALVEDTLSLARIERGEAPLKLERIDWRNLLVKVAGTYRTAAEAAGLNLRTDMDSGLPPTLGDAGLLEQAVGNLVDNAVKYNRPGGSILLNVLRAGESGVRVSVEDTGIGIPAEDLTRVFERFYRVDRARSREMGGTGLGLAIVKHIVDRHGGRVGCSSVLGSGSTFWLELGA